MSGDLRAAGGPVEPDTDHAERVRSIYIAVQVIPQHDNFAVIFRRNAETIHRVLKHIGMRFFNPQIFGNGVAVEQIIQSVIAETIGERSDWTIGDQSYPEAALLKLFN